MDAGAVGVAVQNVLELEGYLKGTCSVYYNFAAYPDMGIVLDSLWFGIQIIHQTWCCYPEIDV